MTDPKKTGSKPAQEDPAGSTQAQSPAPGGLRKLAEIPVILTISALLLTATGLGFTVGRAVSTTIEQAYREDKADLEKKLTQVEKERDLAQQAQAALTEKLRNPSGQGRAGTGSGDTQNAVDVQILVGETAELFKKQLFVSLVGVEAIPAAPRFVASLTFGSPGKDSASMKGRPGDVTAYNGFEIRITSVDAASATVRVQRLSPAIQPQP